MIAAGSKRQQLPASWPFWPVGCMPGHFCLGDPDGQGTWGLPHPPTVGPSHYLSLGGVICKGAGPALKFSRWEIILMTLRGNNCFAELWDAAACPPWSCHVELGSSSASQPGVRELALTFSGVELILFFPAKAGLVWLTGPSFPFLLGPCKERVVWVFLPLS